MRAILEILLSLLAVTGLISIGWLCFGRLFTPAGGHQACTLVPAAGDGDDLEQAVNGLLWLRSGEFLGGKVVILDCGLTPAGRALAVAICRREPGVEICPLSELSVYIKRNTP